MSDLLIAGYFGVADQQVNTILISNMGEFTRNHALLGQSSAADYLQRGL
jgi:hypothetical protein